MPKRSNPSIKDYTLKSGGKRYMFKISLGTNSNGKRIVTTRRGFKSYAEANIAYNELAQTKPDSFVKQKQITVKELYDLWFENYKTTVKESTASQTDFQYKKHIDPYFGNQFIDQITIADVQKWTDDLAKELILYRITISIMSRLFEYGMRLGFIADNPIKKVFIPKRSAKRHRNSENNVYSRKELESFLKSAKECGLTPYIYFKLLSSTGLRKSEGLALEWKDIDFENNTISVQRTLAWTMDYKQDLQSPKSKKSKRIIPLSPSLKSDLQVYRQKQKILSEKVFHNMYNQFYNMAMPYKWLEKIYSLNPKLKKITVHGFRHTFATLLIEETDVKPKTVQALLGHEKIGLTLDIYAHVNDKNKEDAVQALNQLNI